MSYRIGTILILALLVELLYTLFGDGSVSWFPIANMFGAGFVIPNLTPEYIVYYMGEHLAFCFLALILWRETGSEIARYFFVLKSLDLVDYFVTYNHVYFYYHGVPISFNTVACVVFVILTIRVWIKDLF